MPTSMGNLMRRTGARSRRRWPAIGPGRAGRDPDPAEAGGETGGEGCGRAAPRARPGPRLLGWACAAALVVLVGTGWLAPSSRPPADAARAAFMAWSAAGAPANAMQPAGGLNGFPLDLGAAGFRLVYLSEGDGSAGGLPVTRGVTAAGSPSGAGRRAGRPDSRSRKGPRPACGALGQQGAPLRPPVRDGAGRALRPAGRGGRAPHRTDQDGPPAARPGPGHRPL